MIDEYIPAVDLPGSVLPDDLSAIAVWCDNRPALLVHEHLMHTHLMLLSPARKTGMEYEIILPALGIVISRIMAWRDITCTACLRFFPCIHEFEAAHQLHSVWRVYRIIE
ncbi:hypothetical protein D3C73_1213180 [compost metagenome]